MSNTQGNSKHRFNLLDTVKRAFSPPARPLMLTVVVAAAVLFSGLMLAGDAWIVQADDAGSGGVESRGSLGGEPILQLVGRPGQDTTLFARTTTSVYSSSDDQETWIEGAPVGSRPTALAATADGSILFMGTESLGLFRSTDHGASWQSINAGLMEEGQGALSVTALSIHPEDDQIAYVAIGYWLGTRGMRFTPSMVSISVDAGRQWFTVAGVSLGSPRIDRIAPDPYQPLVLTVESQSDRQTLELAVTSRLVAGLGDADPMMRAATARLLGLSGESWVAPALLPLLADTDFTAGDWAAEALGRLSNRQVVPALWATLESENDLVRSRAAYALGLMKIDEAVPQLAKMLNGDGPISRLRAAEALAHIGSENAISALMGPLADAQLTTARHAAMRGLELAGRSAQRTLIDGLQGPDAILRRNSAEMLGWIEARTAVPLLAQALSDSDSDVRAQAAWSLGEIATPAARRALARLVEADTDPYTRHTAETALARAEVLAARRPDLRGHALWEAVASLWERWPALWGILLAAKLLITALLLVRPWKSAFRQSHG